MTVVTAADFSPTVVVPPLAVTPVISPECLWRCGVEQYHEMVPVVIEGREVGRIGVQSLLA
jgi:hypothetical protein